MMREPSLLISCNHWPPEGSLSVLVGRHGAMNPAGKVRCNIMPIVRDYSRASQCFLFARLVRAEHDFVPPDAGVRQVSGRDQWIVVTFLVCRQLRHWDSPCCRTMPWAKRRTW